MKNIFSHKREQLNMRLNKAYITNKNTMNKTTNHFGGFNARAGIYFKETIFAEELKNNGTSYRSGKGGMVDIGAMLSDEKGERSRGRMTYRQKYLSRYQGNRPLLKQQMDAAMVNQEQHNKQTD